MTTIGSCFSGIGGFELGLERALNAKTVWQIENNPFCQRILRKHWPDCDLYDDIQTIKPSSLSPVDIICGGFPCQDISISGRRTGLQNGKKSSLWNYMFRIIDHLRPRIVCLENSPHIVRLGLDTLCGQMASIGYDIEWGVVSAKSMGAPHNRKRWFAIAYPHSLRAQVQAKRKNASLEMFRSFGSDRSSHWRAWPSQSGICGRDDGISGRVDRIKALGNAIVPQCSEYIGHLIKEIV